MQSFHTTSEDLEYSTQSHMDYFYDPFYHFLELESPSYYSDCIEKINLDTLLSNSF